MSRILRLKPLSRLPSQQKQNRQAAVTYMSVINGALQVSRKQTVGNVLVIRRYRVIMRDHDKNPYRKTGCRYE